MFKYNQIVKDVNTGELFRVVAPILYEKEEVAVWADIDCRNIRIFPREYLEATYEKLMDGAHGHIVYDVKSLGENKLGVQREVDVVGADSILAVYSDFRRFVEEYSPMPMMELDALIDAEAVRST